MTMLQRKMCRLPVVALSALQNSGVIDGGVSVVVLLTQEAEAGGSL